MLQWVQQVKVKPHNITALSLANDSFSAAISQSLQELKQVSRVIWQQATLMLDSQSMGKTRHQQPASQNAGQQHVWKSRHDPLKSSRSHGGSRPKLMQGSLGSYMSFPKWYQDRFSHFCTAHSCAQHTQTHRPYSCSIHSNGLQLPHLCTMYTWCSLK